MKRARSLWFGVIAAVVLLLLAFTFLVMPRMRGITVPNLPAETILTGGVAGAIVGFVSVLIAEYFRGKRHSEALLHARELEAQRAQEAALQRYLEQVGKLLADPDRPLHRSTPGDTLSTVARAQTLSILEGLDEPARKRILVQFLYESGLIHKHKAVVDLAEANLLKADLSNSSLVEANLEKASLGEGNLQKADLRGATLRGANLQGAHLEGADLRGTNLQGASRMTQDQIELTLGSRATKLPEGLNRPELWSKSLAEQIEQIKMLHKRGINGAE